MHKNATSKEIMTWLISLGFNVNSKFRGQYYAETEMQDDQLKIGTRCIHIPNSKVLTTIKDNKFYSYNKFSEKNIKKHLLAKYNTKPKRKKNIDTSLYTKEQLIKIRNLESTMGGFSHWKSNVLALDIDCHDGNTEKTLDTLTKVIKFLDYSEPLFIEQSNTNSGFHIYYKFDRVISDFTAKEFVRLFNKKYKVKIECRTSKKFLRLPLAFSYDQVIITNLNELSENKSDKVELSKVELSIKEQLELFESIEQIDLSKYKYFKETKIVPLQFMTSSKMYGTSINPKDYPLYCGNRISNHMRLAYSCKANNLTLDDFYAMSLDANIDSKDMSSDRAYKICKDVYDNTKFSERKIQASEEFISNIEKVPYYFISDIEKKCNEYFNKDTVWSKKYNRASKLLIKELIGHTYYQQENPRRIYDKSTVTASKRQHLLQGYVFTRSFLLSFKKHYYLDINVFNLFNIIMKDFNLFTQYKHNKLGYCFNKRFLFSRQWKLMYDDISESIKEWINRTKIGFKVIINIYQLFLDSYTYKPYKILNRNSFCSNTS